MNKLGNLACLTKQNVSYFLKDFFGLGVIKKLEDRKQQKRRKKNEDRKDLVFPHVYLVGVMENYFIWLERKLSGRMENIIYIN